MDKQKLILCACDLSQSSDRAVALAAELAQAFGAQVELLHVNVLRLEAPPFGLISGTPAYRTHELAEARERLELQRVRLAESGVQATVNVVEAADAATAIVERARGAGAMLLAIGTHGRSGFRHLVMGSTAERVVRTAEVPVLVARELGRSASG